MDLENLRCRCGKIVCQTAGDLRPDSKVLVRDVILIKCRHCKRYIAIFTRGVTEIKYLESEGQVAHGLSI